jgi:hypothetical protein
VDVDRRVGCRESVSMSALIVVAMLVVAGCAGARLIGPTAHAAGAAGPLDVEVWHGVMGLTMATMVMVPISTGPSRLTLAVFGGGVLWCLVRLTVTGARAAYLRLAVCCTAMVAMLVPASTTRTAATGPMSGMAGMTGMPGMEGTRMNVLPRIITVVLLVAVVGVVLAAASRLSRPKRASRAPSGMHRVQAFGEMAMAGAMAYMLAGLV